MKERTSVASHCYSIPVPVCRKIKENADAGAKSVSGQLFLGDNTRASNIHEQISASITIVMFSVNRYDLHANLLVVFLPVAIYNSSGGGLSGILPKAGGSDSRVATKPWLQPGRYDVFWIFNPSLATNRGRATDYPDYAFAC